jgi:proline racemase/trans-L-3-hydroxyproline dehydratase
MEFERILYVVDTHVMGEPARVVLSGIGGIPGRTMFEKKEYMKSHMDFIRQILINKPRGHRDMFAVVMTQPTLPEADIGLIYMDSSGYLNMCVHGTIGAVTAAIKMGIVRAEDKETEVIVETPAGLVFTRASIREGKVDLVTVRNVASFLYKSNVEIDIPEVGKINLDIAFGGNFFALVDARKLNIKIVPQELEKIIKLGMQIRNAVNRKIKVVHPLMPNISGVDLVEFYGPPASENATLKNVVVFGRGQVDRSPCGTGTCAKMAELYAKGLLRANTPFYYESIIGTVFKGEIVKETKVGDFVAVVPEVTGKAYITGFNQLVIEKDDPLKFGFMIK